jgi:hypothetical protein
MSEQKSVGRPANPNRKQRINVTFAPDTLSEMETRIPEKDRSKFIEKLVRKELGLPELEDNKMIGFAAYKRDFSAGFATEIVLVSDGIIVDQFSQTHNPPTPWIEDLPDRVGQPMVSLKAWGFRRVTNASEIKQLHERYLASKQNVD